jgi:hypothetical protein
MDQTELCRKKFWTVEHLWNVFMFVRASDVDDVVAELNALGASNGLVYEERASHPHKIHFCDIGRLTMDIYLWKARFRGWKYSAATKLQDASGNPMGSIVQGIVLAGVHFGLWPYYKHVIEREVERVIRDDLGIIEKHAGPFETVVLIIGTSSQNGWDGVPETGRHNLSGVLSLDGVCVCSRQDTDGTILFRLASQ